MQIKIAVGVLGATGSVGQKFIQLLSGHPWFEVTALAASERSAGKTYREAVHWILPTPIPEDIAGMKISECEPDLPCRIVFSGLDASVAGEIEEHFARAGYLVVSNAKNHRWDEHVPLLIPEINPDHLSLIKHQPYGKGAIVTNPNCSTTGLVMALKPLADRFGLKRVLVVTLQALSGAGFPGVSSLDITDNVIPYIAGEEEKVQNEPLKIMGRYEHGKIKQLELPISAHCNRVAVLDGHLECVSVTLHKQTSPEEIIETWNSFSSEPQDLKLPMAPERTIYYFHEPNFPQPRLHRGLDKGMAVSVGRLRKCPVLDYKFVLLSHNTVRGAAGGAILNAELMVKRGLI